MRLCASAFRGHSRSVKVGQSSSVLTSTLVVGCRLGGLGASWAAVAASSDAWAAGRELQLVALRSRLEALETRQGRGIVSRLFGRLTAR